MKKEKAEKIEELAKRRGFFWLSSEIHGGLSGFYDYGHLGTMLKRKFENLWRKFFLEENFYEIETCNIMPESVFHASGHLRSFVDPIVKCKKCGLIERADQIIESEKAIADFEGLTPDELSILIKKYKIKCPKCKGEFADAGVLNMMFPIKVGTAEGVTAYLRPETAQGVYVNFNRAFEQLRRRLPLGLATIGKVYRNEISPRNLLIRMREFSQAELQIFFDPDKINEHENFFEVLDYKLRLFPVANRKKNKIDEISCEDVVKKLKLPKFYVYYMAKIQKFYLDLLKLQKEKFRFRELSEEERAFYNKIHWDIELDIESLDGFREVAGIHYRSSHDLEGHQKISKEDMSITINGKKFIPHVIELSFGIDRNLYALIDLTFKEEKERTLLKFPRLLSPYDCAVFPLLNKDGLPEKANEVKNMLMENFSVFYDESGSVGRRYRRMDEIGVACCITIDHKTLEDNTVTMRDRDSMKQIRIPIDDLSNAIKKFLQGEELENLGEIL